MTMTLVMLVGSMTLEKALVKLALLLITWRMVKITTLLLSQVGTCGCLLDRMCPHVGEGCFVDAVVYIGRQCLMHGMP